MPPPPGWRKEDTVGRVLGGDGCALPAGVKSEVGAHVCADALSRNSGPITEVRGDVLHEGLSFPVDLHQVWVGGRLQPGRESKRRPPTLLDNKNLCECVLRGGTAETVESETHWLTFVFACSCFLAMNKL